jgi:hypothetical protein
MSLVRLFGLPPDTLPSADVTKAKKAGNGG